MVAVSDAVGAQRRGELGAAWQGMSPRAPAGGQILVQVEKDGVRNVVGFVFPTALFAIWQVPTGVDDPKQGMVALTDQPAALTSGRIIVVGSPARSMPLAAALPRPDYGLPGKGDGLERDRKSGIQRHLVERQKAPTELSER